MKPSVALFCLALGVYAHAFSVPVIDVTTPALAPIEPVPAETSPPAVADTTTTPPAPVDADTTTTPPAPVVTDTTTTTIPPPPYQCYDCNSGIHTPGGWVNDDCPVNGNIKPNVVTFACNGHCVSYVTRYPPGTGFRLCDDKLWFPENFDTSPGCRMFNNNYMCFSAGDRSNVHNLTSMSQFYLDQYYKSLATPAP